MYLSFLITKSMDVSLVRFSFDGIEVSSFVDDKGRDWFRGSEVCKILEITNPSVVIKREAAEYWQELKIGVGRPALYVSEPGLYSLIFSSKAPVAQKFKKWVFEEVLPKLRAEGGYIRPNATQQQIEALQVQLDERRWQAISELNQQVSEQYPYIMKALQASLDGHNPYEEFWLQGIASQEKWRQKIRQSENRAKALESFKPLIELIKNEIRTKGKCCIGNAEFSGDLWLKDF